MFFWYSLSEKNQEILTSLKNYFITFLQITRNQENKFYKIYFVGNKILKRKKVNLHKNILYPKTRNYLFTSKILAKKNPWKNITKNHPQNL